MNLISPHRIEDFIVKLLIEGEQGTTTLLEHVRKYKKELTKQGFYAALRKLKGEEIILIYKKKVSLNTAWIKKMKESFEKIARTYTTEQKSFDVLGLEDRESISYTFSTIKNLDIFWGHSQNILIHNTEIDQPIYAYDPHYWFYVARKETELELLREIIGQKRQFLMCVGGTTKLDKSIRKDFHTHFLQYNHKKLFEKDNYYVTVIGDYVTEVFLDESISKKINDIYHKAESNDLHAHNILKTLLEAQVRNKIKISRNKKKAGELKKKMGRDFYILKK